MVAAAAGPDEVAGGVGGGGAAVGSAAAGTPVSRTVAVIRAGRNKRDVRTGDLVVCRRGNFTVTHESAFWIRPKRAINAGPIRRISDSFPKVAKFQKETVAMVD
jgi:hypothetical protein